MAPSLTYTDFRGSSNSGIHFHSSANATGSSQEQEVVEYPYSCYVLGRSGTGYKRLLLATGYILTYHRLEKLRRCSLRWLVSRKRGMSPTVNTLTHGRYS